METKAPRDRELSHAYTFGKCWDVSIKIVSQSGTCRAGHKVGDQWLMKYRETPEGICLRAFESILPFVRVLMYGGRFDWSTDPDSIRVNCPEANSQVVLELRRQEISDELVR